MCPEQCRLCCRIVAVWGKGEVWALALCLVAFVSVPNKLAAQSPPNTPVEATPTSSVDDPASRESPASAMPLKRMLLAENFPNGEWVFFGSKKELALKDTWKLLKGDKPDDLTLICTGKPYGYIRTHKVYGDFELGLQWRYPVDENGNSGLLLFTAGEDRLWPDSLQIQLHHSTAGSTFPSGAAKADNELRNVPALSRPLGQWNDCVVLSEQGRVTVTINGKKVGEVTGCSPHMGTIALQSEGSEIHFRQIWIREVSRSEASMSREGSNLLYEEEQLQRGRRRGLRSRTLAAAHRTNLVARRKGWVIGLDLPNEDDYLPTSCVVPPDSQVCP